MTDNNHPITPPSELVLEWHQATVGTHFPLYGYREYIATQAAQWGADQQLEACCEWVEAYAECGNALRAACRPKPPSLAEEALEALEAEDDDRPLRSLKTGERFDIIRAALERLRELEKSND